MKATSAHQRVKAFMERFLRVFHSTGMGYEDLKGQLNSDYLHESDAIIHGTVTWKWIHKNQIPSEERLLALMEWVKDHDKTTKRKQQ